MSNQKYTGWKDLLATMNLNQHNIARRQLLKASALGLGVAGLEILSTTLPQARSRASAAERERL